MSVHRVDSERDHGRGATAAVASAGGWEDPREIAARTDPPQLRVRTIKPVAIIRFEGAEILFAESAVRAVGDRLNRLIDEGHTRLQVNFGGVRYLPSDMLSILVGVQRKVEPARGGIQLCGLDPLLRNMLRITRLDSVFEVCTDETEALGLLVS